MKAVHKSGTWGGGSYLVEPCWCIVCAHKYGAAAAGVAHRVLSQSQLSEVPVVLMFLDFRDVVQLYCLRQSGKLPDFRLKFKAKNESSIRELVASCDMPLPPQAGLQQRCTPSVNRRQVSRAVLDQPFDNTAAKAYTPNL